MRSTKMEFLKKQFFSLSIDTKAFMNEEELALNNHKNFISSELNKLKENIDNNVYDEDTTLWGEYKYSLLNMYKKEIKQTTEKFITLLDYNIGNKRELKLENYVLNKDNFNEDWMKFSKRISLFDNQLSRAIGVKEDEFTDAIITIRVYHNSLLKSLINN